jgi:hypothetical protein
MIRQAGYPGAGRIPIFFPDQIFIAQMSVDA